MYFLHSMLLVSILLDWETVYTVANEGCNSPQYLEIGKTGVIQCSFQGPFFGMFWYNTTNTVHNSPVIEFLDRVPSGGGYESGEYDIYSNGSLKITNVSTLHDGNFTAVKFLSLEDNPVHHVVAIVTTVKPVDNDPYIQGCTDETIGCFTQFHNTSELLCIVRGARPTIKLDWVLRMPDGDKLLPFHVHFEHDGTTSSTFATLTYEFYKKSILSLLVCKAHSLPGILHNEETSILIEDSEKKFSYLVPIPKYVERDSRLELVCSDMDISLVVWKKSRNRNLSFEITAFAILYGETIVRKNLDDIELSNGGSLTIPRVEVKHEGLYGCVFENGVTGDRKLFDVVVYVPVYPSIDGCTKYQYCTLPVHTDGLISCFVKGIRPLVHLEVATFYEGDSNLIKFTNNEVIISNHGDVYDINLTLNYKITQSQTNRLPLECRVTGSNIKILHVATKFELLIEDGHIADHESEGRVLSPFLWILVAIIPLSLVIFVIVRFTIKKGKRKQQPIAISKHQEGEDIPMFSNLGLEQSFVQEKRTIFVKQLKGKYEDLYNAVQPVPYIRDRLFCVDRVFVEGGLEFLVSTGSGNWEMLETYHNIFNNSEIKSSRRILEGEPGYGKSTLTLQLTYDWCNRTMTSPLKDIEILILLRLRQLGRVSSIYRAIKQFILPRDSQLTEGDIRTIVTSTYSTVIILDGYDEYPDQNDNASDVNNIITRQMFQDFDVILTTRSSCLPKKYAPQTKRVRLTGFDDQARDAYIKKAVVGNDSVATDKIKQRLGENPVLGDLCQAPLFFVMFAHMSHESEEVLSFDSVTSFFRHMISCFHTHMKNKMEDENVEQFEVFETDHQALDGIAFEGLSEKNQQIVWSKEKLRKRLGENFYDQYISIGILVEEEILKVRNIPGIRMTEHIQRKTEVRFYHKLFCEWYAAYFLSENARKLSPEDLHAFLKNVDPFDLQFVYRFACGLDPAAADMIIAHLQSTKEGEKFAILCILEKTGDIDKMTETVSQLCSKEVSIRKEDNKLLQRSTIQLLEIASRHEISISRVYLDNCYSTVYLSGGYHLQLKSNLYIPVLTTLNKLVIQEIGREITVEEFTDILQYSSKCLALKELALLNCLLPQSVQAESVSILRSRNADVLWHPGFDSSYRLNLESRHWEHGGRVMTDEDYQKVVNGRTWRRN